MNGLAMYVETQGVSQDALVLQHAPLVKRIVYHMMGRLPSTVSPDDLIQAGMMGLLEASRHYDVTQGASFETYAGICIRGSILDEVRKNDWAPRSVYKKARTISAAVRIIENREGRDARDHEVAEELGISVDEYNHMLHDASGYRLTSFDEVTSPEEAVIDGLIAAKASGFAPIKINMVAMKGINDDEFEDMVNFCLEHDFTLRFIETMPIGDTGVDASQHYLSLKEVKNKLADQYELIPGVMPGGGPARYMQVKDTNLRIGFITPISQHFCETCNRVRLSVDGTLYLCLGQDHKYELRPLLRQGISDDGLKNAIIEAIAIKPEKHEFRNNPGQVVRFMSMTGG